MFVFVLAALYLFVTVRCDQGQPEVLLFNKVDTNHDDKLTRVELDDVFLLFDKNKDNEVTPDEFTDGWVNVFQIGSSDEAGTLFTRADTNDDGYIDMKDIPTIFSFFDENGDGSVDIDEFLTEMGNLELSPPDESNVSVDITG
ncbi:insoluble matrix shell protein 5-like [Mya arenaria]|uniref:insoluble matrix shell protein 5-like n=1 Tax=Mya arenaria TaxID=6604 RepID=UPI0022E91C43|nr:insoluble matrix shell protein 5-like [Mya arenaria]